MIEWFLDRIPSVIALWLSLTVHEWAHARAAYALGDDTARGLGRMTLDPTAHLDLVGTFALPLLGVPFGWATPVPVRPERFRRDVSMSFGLLLTAVAGPASNLVLAAMGAGAVIALDRLGALAFTHALIIHAVALNVALAVFNLMPLPPLDGSRVVSHFVPRALLPWWGHLESAGPVAAVGFLMVLELMGLSPVGPLVSLASGYLWQAVGG